MLVLCPECGAKISSEANPCPKCGYPFAGHRSEAYCGQKAKEMVGKKASRTSRCCGVTEDSEMAVVTGTKVVRGRDGVGYFTLYYGRCSKCGKEADFHYLE